MKKEAISLAALMLVAFLLRGALLSRVEIISPDEAYFVRMSQHLAEWKSFGEFNLIERGFKGQPVFPYLLSLFVRLGKDPVAVCQWISIFFGVLTLLAFHGCVRSLGSSKDALGADLFYALSPVAIQYSLWAMPHAVFNFCLVSFLFFVLKAQKSVRFVWMGLAGLAAAGAYLARVEGILMAAAFLAAALVFRWFRWRALVVFMAAFAILSFPFWLWLYRETGIWQFTWSEGRGASGIYVDFIQKIIQDLNASSFFKFYLRNLYGAYLLLPKIVPIIFWILAGFGFVRILRSGSKAAGHVGMLVFFSAFPVFFYPMLEAVEARFLSPALIFLLMPAGAGISSLAEETFRRHRLAKGICLFLAIGSFLPGMVSLWKSFREDAMEQRRMGEWTLSYFGKSPRILFGSDSRFCFYAEAACGHFVGMRQAVEAGQRGEDLIQFLRRENVDLAAVDSRYVPKFYPSLKFLLNSPPKEWRALVKMIGGDEKITLYELPKEEPLPKGNG